MTRRERGYAFGVEVHRANRESEIRPDRGHRAPEVPEAEHADGTRVAHDTASPAAATDARGWNCIDLVLPTFATTLLPSDSSM